MTETIDIYDKKTSLSDLRDVLGWNTTQDNLENLVMVLCSRVEKLQTRIEKLEGNAITIRCLNIAPTSGAFSERIGMMSITKEEKPDFVTEEHLEYLDQLRESAVTNMLGATPFIRQEYPELSKGEAKQVLRYWMETFGERKS